MIAQKSKYALRALLALARAGPGETVQIGTIAAREGIPKKFLEQILLDLKHAGLVVSRRGQHGGYRLLRRPEDIAFGEVLRILEGPFVPLACLAKDGGRRCDDCRDERFCAVRRVFARVAAASGKSSMARRWRTFCRTPRKPPAAPWIHPRTSVRQLFY